MSKNDQEEEIGIGIFNDNVVNNHTRLGCEEKARMHLNGLVEPWGHVAQNQRNSMITQVGVGIGIFNDNIDVETTTNHDEL